MSTPAHESPHPPYLYPDYRSTTMRAPSRPLIPLHHTTLSETTGPMFGAKDIAAEDANLTSQHDGAPIGQRIVIAGRVLDGAGTPLPQALVEVWQANAAGRYAHPEDQHDAPLDPNFSGGGRCLTDEEGWYRFTTIHPGAYPWLNHPNAWRPAHIHFSVFGRSFAARLVTQVYFPGDPLLDYDPIFHSVPPSARHRLIAAFDLGLTQPGVALGFRWDVVLGGPASTPEVD